MLNTETSNDSTNYKVRYFLRNLCFRGNRMHKHPLKELTKVEMEMHTIAHMHIDILTHTGGAPRMHLFDNSLALSLPQ